MTPAPTLQRWRTLSKVGAWVVAGVAVLAVACMALAHTAYFQRAVVRYVAARLHHDVDVNGALQMDLLSRSPSMTAADVTFRNPPWMPPGVAARVGRLTVVFDFPLPGQTRAIRRLEMISARLHLVRDAQGHANWQWTAPGVPKKGRGVLVRSLYMPDARVVLDDARRHVQFEGTVTAADVRGAGPPPPLRIEGSGQLNGRPATFSIDSDPLATASHDRPYAFTFVERSGNAQLRGHGHLLKPFDPGMLDAEFAANGASMSELYFLAGMHFPSSAPFTLTGRLERRDRQSTLRDLVAHFGRSDVRGTVALEIVDGRSQFKADLSSKLLRLGDFGRHRADGSALPSSSPAQLLMPDVQVPLKGLRSHDAVVRYRADTVESHAMSVSAFSTQATIDRGVLTAKALSGRVRDGHLAGTAKIDVRRDVPQTTLDLTIADLPLDQFARKENQRPPFEGLLRARVDISGHGNSVHELAASANGALSLSMSGGAMRASMAEMSAATLRGLGLKLMNSDQETPVRCGVATFRARDGVLSAERILIDTDPVVITGTGDIRLGTESLDLTLQGEPREARLVRLHRSVTIAGSLKHPSVQLGAQLPVAQTSTDDAVKGVGSVCEPALAGQLPSNAPVR